MSVANRKNLKTCPPPFGDFAVDTESNEPVVLLWAGVGVTPMIAALNRIARHQPQRHVFFAHAARDAAHHAHRDDIANAMACMPNLQVLTFYLPCSESTGLQGGDGENGLRSNPGSPR